MKMSQFVSITLVIILGMFLNTCGQMTSRDQGMSSKSIEEASVTTDDTTNTGNTTTNSMSAFNFTSFANSELSSYITGTITGTIITATVPYGTDVSALVATFTHDGGNIKIGSVRQTSGTTANNFASAVSYTIMAEDGTTKDYIVTITVASIGAKEITAFSFSQDYPLIHTVYVNGVPKNIYGSLTQTAIISGTNITATVPYGTNVSIYRATYTTTGFAVYVGEINEFNDGQKSGDTYNHFGSPLTYTVLAFNGDTQNYTVNVTIAPNDAKEITTFSFIDKNASLSSTITSTISGTNITATVPYGTDVTALVATYTTTGLSVSVGGTAQTTGTTVNNFSSALTYTVLAANGDTQNYTVNVTIAES
jgi:hypothetical protein